MADLLSPMFDDLLLKGIQVEFSISEDRELVYITLISKKPMSNDKIFDILSEYAIVCFEKHDNQVKH